MLSICVPTRGRPGRFAEMYTSALRTAQGDIEVIGVFDSDDESRKEYPKGPRYVTVEAGRQNQSHLWNVAWDAASGDIAHMGADDLIYRTRGWDLTVARALDRWRPSRIGMVYVNDLHPCWHQPFYGQLPADRVGDGYVFACNPFVHRAWIDAVSSVSDQTFFTPPFYKSWEADSWIYLLAEGIERAVFLPRVIIEHMHPMAGKAEMDATYARGAWGNERLKRQGWNLTRSVRMRQLRNVQIQALQAAIAR